MSFLNKLKKQSEPTPFGQSLFGNASPTEGGMADTTRQEALNKVIGEREASGEPQLVLRGRTAEIASALGREAIHIKEASNPGQPPEIKVNPIGDVPQDAFDSAGQFVKAKEATGQLHAVDPAIIEATRAEVEAQGGRSRQQAA